jgi:hypothetical protein
MWPFAMIAIAMHCGSQHNLSTSYVNGCRAWLSGTDSSAQLMESYRGRCHQLGEPINENSKQQVKGSSLGALANLLNDN